MVEDVRHRTLQSNGISMHVAEAGPEDGPAVILCHGFPELWYSWRHQLPVLAAAGFRVIAPDQRGYGRTDAPRETEAFDIAHLTGDLTGLLDVLGEERAVFVGHDWGAIVVWALSVMAPDRVRAVAGLSVPFAPRPPIPPTQLFNAMAGERFMYILYFQEEGPADRELSADPRRALASIFYSVSADAPRGSVRRLPRQGTSYLDTMTEPDALPVWLSKEDLGVYTAEFVRTGFTGALNWYRNFDRNWQLMEFVAGANVTMPALYVAGALDPVVRFVPADLMEGWVRDLRGSVLLPNAGHWVQQEQPDAVNRLLLDFLAGL
jgi:pimeloyl-ACP methyl ester carboxylesterase